ncbi:Tbc1d10b [Symbiodinium pilosum]|uniref:Tbc1d10b protein n=1 Tax=Symbiodinium pilosum TaxID=2952 RepID=A0A812IVR0_SYMPI|nr:Tbc1d10b [Symbiodinium pilosum]
MGCGCVSQHQVGIPGRGPRQFLYTATDKEFVSTLDKEELKDKNLLLTYFRLDHEGHFVVTDGFRDLVRRKGVPRRYRWRAWRALTGWSALSKPGWYERIMRKAPDSKTVEAIEKDLDRTFPGLEDFDDRKKRELANMLRAHAGLFPSVGYCQGMNFVAGFLLLVAGRVPDASKDAFFLLVQMMVKYRANLLFCDGLPLLKLHTFQYRTLLQRLFPDVHRHFMENQITPELYLTKWILTVFTQPLCFDAAARVWDLIVCDGLQAVVLIGLGIVKLRRSRLLQEDTEGILDMLSMRDGEPLAGGDIVKAALALETQIAPGSISDGTGVRPSKLFAEWETACPAEVEDFHRAEAEICTSKDDWYQSESQDSDAVVSIGEGGWCDESAERANVAGAVRSDAGCPSIAPVCSGMQDQVSLAAEEPGLADEEGGPVVSHPIAAEAKVAVNPSMPLRKPSRATAGSRLNGGKRSESDRGRAPGNPKRSSSLGRLVGPLQSGGPLMCEEDPLYNSPKFVRSGTGSKTKLSDGTEMRREEAGHRRVGGNPGREAGARTLKASGSPPAPAPDIRRGNRSAPSRSSSNQSWTSNLVGRSRSGLDLEVADEHRGLECKAIPVARKSRTSPVSSTSKLPPSPAMSSREILEDLSMHGRTWPEQMAGLVGGKDTKADTPISPTQRAPFTRTRSRNDHEDLEPPPSARIDSSEQSANKSPQFWDTEDRRVRSLSPRAGDRSQSPLDAGRTACLQSLTTSKHILVLMLKHLDASRAVLSATCLRVT